MCRRLESSPGPSALGPSRRQVSGRQETVVRHLQDWKVTMMSKNRICIWGGSAKKGCLTACSARRVVFLVLAMVPCSTNGQDLVEANEAPSARVLWHKAPALFPVRVVPPDGYDSTRIYPAVVALHGFGGSSTSFERIAQPFVQAGFIVILPEAPNPVPSDDSERHSSWTLTTFTTPPLTGDATLERRSALLTTIDFLPSAVDVVQERFQMGPSYIFGFSLGGFEALVTGFYNRERFDGIIAASSARLGVSATHRPILATPPGPTSGARAESVARRGGRSWARV